MKIKVKNNLDGCGGQIEILPSLDFFWYEGAYAICFGWLIFVCEIWFGNTK